MGAPASRGIRSVIGEIPYRMAFAGGWIDQPFLSRLDPEPPGSMVVVALEPTFRWMDRCGMATSTRAVATRLWNERLPAGDPAELVRELYAEENAGRSEPSGSQDMVGLIYPGVSRLDYDFSHEGGIFPRQVESTTDPKVARWLERVIRVVPVAQRPEGYSPLGVKNLDPTWIRRLGRSGQDCWEAILRRDAAALGASMNECMLCWVTILPHILHHPAVMVDLAGILRAYQERSAGAMYSGCGGGYLYVASEEPIEGSFSIQVRTGRGGG
ncbi:MAG: hypothetical protein IMZ69_10010 [Spirochaetes bacterium]|nr:hypothetical protein [Spirochaetota bacterium]